jgi:hypothetical protein
VTVRNAWPWVSLSSAISALPRQAAASSAAVSGLGRSLRCTAHQASARSKASIQPAPACRTRPIQATRLARSATSPASTAWQVEQDILAAIGDEPGPPAMALVVVQRHRAACLFRGPTPGVLNMLGARHALGSVIPAKAGIHLSTS